MERGLKQGFDKVVFRIAGNAIISTDDRVCSGFIISMNPFPASGGELTKYPALNPLPNFREGEGGGYIKRSEYEQRID